MLGSRLLRRQTSRQLEKLVALTTRIESGNNGGHHSLFFSTATGAPASSLQSLRIPPNLTFDPRCSFAPETTTKKAIRPVATVETEDDDREEMDYEEDGTSELVEDDEIGELYLPEREIFFAKPLPDRLNVEVHTLFAPEHSTLTGTLYLDESVFGCDPIRVDFLKRAVNYYRARKRGRRTAKTKTISEVSGSGRKVRQQKGTGRARAGHSRPPHWRGGAKAHGIKNNTDYGNTKLNKKFRRAATRHVLSQKLKENNLLVLNQLHDLPTHKTGQLARLLEPWGIGGPNGVSALVLDHYYPSEEEGMPDGFEGVPANFHVAAKNIPKLHVENTDAANVWEILKYDKLVLTLAALGNLEKRLAIEL